MAIFLHRLAKSVGYLFIVKYDITLSELICHLVLLTVPALCHCHEHKTIQEQQIDGSRGKHMYQL